ncbi:hypothetical protein [Bosea beijingensis]|uniref:hypothetical protein n=1 Tax=Bosea beijingensis TaxID=3068632 RepID=UPI002741237B|nr:hypothetical protein [Bosea sp. REN20]
MLHDMVGFATIFFQPARILLEHRFGAYSLMPTIDSQPEPMFKPLENALESLP